MKTIYIDGEFKCYTESATGRVAVETDAFDEKCSEYIEGYRFVPSGETWTREDSVTFAGEMFAPWKDYATLDAAQREYERQLLADAIADRDAAILALAELGVTV